MNTESPMWIWPPSHAERQTENYRLWRILIRERLIRNPPVFLQPLSEIQLRLAFREVDESGAGSPNRELSPLTLQLRAYEHQFELISWSYFKLMGNELKALAERLSSHEFAAILHEVQLSHEEARLAILVAETREDNPAGFI